MLRGTFAPRPINIILKIAKICIRILLMMLFRRMGCIMADIRKVIRFLIMISANI